MAMLATVIARSLVDNPPSLPLPVPDVTGHVYTHFEKVEHAMIQAGFACSDLEEAENGAAQAADDPIFGTGIVVFILVDQRAKL